MAALVMSSVGRKSFLPLPRTVEVGFIDALKDYALYMGNPTEWERRRALADEEARREAERLRNEELARRDKATREWRREEQAIAAQRAAQEKYGWTFGGNGWFHGRMAVIETGRVDEEYGAVTDIFYDGEGGPLGRGHGHLVMTTDESVVFWREPGKTTPTINSKAGKVLD